MQRNSGNALSGLGGGNGADSFLSARGKGNLLTRATAILATLMFILALALDLYYKGNTKKADSITDVAPLTQEAPAVPSVPDTTSEANTATEQEAKSADIPANVEETPAPSENDVPQETSEAE